MPTWNTLFEQTPNQDTYGYLLAQEIVNSRVAVRERVDKEHHLELTESQALQGIHRQGSAMAYVVSGTPAVGTRPDGVNPLDDNDKGRLLVSVQASLPLLYYWEYSNGVGRWRAISLGGFTGVVAFFPVQRYSLSSSQYADWGWLPCDGQTVCYETGGQGVYGDPRFEALVKFLAGPNATLAMLPRIPNYADTRARYIGAWPHSSSEGLEGAGPFTTPKIEAQNVGQHTHDLETMIDADWGSNPTFSVQTKDGDGKHNHRVDGSGTAGSLGSTNSRIKHSSWPNPNHWLRSNDPRVDDGSAHRHTLEFTKNTELAHTHRVKNNSNEVVNRPDSVYLYAYIHI